MSKFYEFDQSGDYEDEKLASIVIIEANSKEEAMDIGRKIGMLFDVDIYCGNSDMDMDMDLDCSVSWFEPIVVERFTSAFSYNKLEKAEEHQEIYGGNIIKRKDKFYLEFDNIESYAKVLIDHKRKRDIYKHKGTYRILYLDGTIKRNYF